MWLESMELPELLEGRLLEGRLSQPLMEVLSRQASLMEVSPTSGSRHASLAPAWLLRLIGAHPCFPLVGAHPYLFGLQLRFEQEHGQ